MSLWVMFPTYMSYMVLTLLGKIRDFFGVLTGSSRYFSADRRPPPVRTGSRAVSSCLCARGHAHTCVEHARHVHVREPDWAGVLVWCSAALWCRATRPC